MRNLVALSCLLCLPSVAQARSDEERFHDSGSTYVAAVHARLHDRWKSFTDLLYQMPEGSRYRDDRSLAVTVEVALWPDGTIVHVDRTTESGLVGFDQAPTDLLHEVAHLPPPPAELRSDDGRIYLRWRFDRLAADGDRGAVIEKRIPIDQAMERLVAAGHADQATARIDQEIADHPAYKTALLWVLADAFARHDAVAVNPAVRVASARALAVLDDNGTLLTRLAHDPAPAVRAAALDAIAQSPPSPETLSVVTTALDGQDAASAAQAIERIARGNREHGGAATTGIDRAALASSVEEALRAGHAPLECVEALRALGDPPRVLRSVTALLASSSTRLNGARAALQLADPALDRPLLDALAQAGSEEQPVLLDALGKLGPRLSPQGKSALMKATHDPRPAVRAAATRAAGLVGERRARPRFVDGLIDSDATVRAAAVNALVAAAGNEAADELFRPLRDPAPSVRAALGAALIAHPITRGEPMLQRLRKDPEPVVRAAATPSPAAIADATPTAPDLEARLRDAATDLARAEAVVEWLTFNARASSQSAPTRPNGQSTKIALSDLDP